MSLITQSASESEKGFLKAPSTYIITNDLQFRHITPLDLVDYPEYFDFDANELVEQDVIIIGINEVTQIVHLLFQNLFLCEAYIVFIFYASYLRF